MWGWRWSRCHAASPARVQLLPTAFGLRARPSLERRPRAPEFRERSPAEAGPRPCIHPRGSEWRIGSCRRAGNEAAITQLLQPAGSPGLGQRGLLGPARLRPGHRHPPSGPELRGWKTPLAAPRATHAQHHPVSQAIAQVPQPAFP